MAGTNTARIRSCTPHTAPCHPGLISCAIYPPQPGGFISFSKSRIRIPCPRPCKAQLKTGHACRSIAKVTMAHFTFCILITDSAPYLIAAYVKPSFCAIRSIDQSQISFRCTRDVHTWIARDVRTCAMSGLVSTRK